MSIGHNFYWTKLNYWVHIENNMFLKLDKQHSNILNSYFYIEPTEYIAKGDSVGLTAFLFRNETFKISCE